MSKARLRNFVGATAALAALCALPLGASAGAQNQTPAAAPADLNGTYQCQPNPDPCIWSGPTASLSQSGDKLQIKGADGAVADATLTSASTISAMGTFNSIGIVRADHSIDWSDGTKWARQ